jgi:hypothetical protein
MTTAGAYSKYEKIQYCSGSAIARPIRIPRSKRMLFLGKVQIVEFFFQEEFDFSSKVRIL